MGDSWQSTDSPSIAINTPPQTPPARGGAYFDSPSLSRGDSKHSPSLAKLSPFDSPSLAEGARGWVNPSLRESQRDSWQSAQFLPLFEGKMIHQFNATFSTPNYFLDKDAFDNRLKSKEIYRLKQDLGIDSKEYGRLLESLYKSACHSERSEESQMSHKNRDISAFSKPQYDKENSPSLANFIPHPKSLPQGEGLAFNSPSLAEGDKGGGYKSATKITHPLHHPNAREGAFERFPRAMDKTLNTHSKILSEKSGLCSHERGNKTNASIDEASSKLPDLSPKAECASFESTLIRFDRAYFRLAFRAIASDTNERTLIFSLLPKDCGFGHSMFANSAKSYILDSGQIRTLPISHTRICFALGIFNSLIVDFLARTMIQINVSKTYLERIPLPQPSDEQIKSDETYAFIARSALILQLYNDSAGHFAELANEFDIAKSEIPKTQKLYDSLKARLDIKVAKLYGLDLSDFCHILESFKVLHSKQPAYIALLKSLWE